MNNTSRRRPREQMASTSVKPTQQTMDDISYCPSSTFLTQKFALNSYHRTIARKGLGRRPTDFIIDNLTSGRKCNDLDLSVLTQSFSAYRKAVNLILDKVFSDSIYAESLGKELEESKGRMYLVLRKEIPLKWKIDNEFGHLVYERMHRNALETAARIIHSDFTRRRLVNKLLEILASDEKQLLRLTINKRIPSDIVRNLKDTIEKKSVGSFHYALSACRQVRKVLRLRVEEAYPLENGRKRKTRELLDKSSPHRLQTQTMMIAIVKEWSSEGFPFIIPVFKKDTMDYAASTENSTGQGYWFSPDQERQDEIFLYIKTPPGVFGHHDDSCSPYKSQTIRLRFLNWLPRKAARARQKARKAQLMGDMKRLVELEFRADRFEDMSRQLYNTIQIQHLTRELAKERTQPVKNDGRIKRLKLLVQELRKSRTTAPPVIKMTGNKATLIIPFMAPGESIFKKSLSSSIKRSRNAGVDRGLRHSMVVSVKNGDDTYSERMIGKQELYEKRERLRQQTRVLMSNAALKRNNWEKKHSGLQPPVHLLKKERELESVWRKVRRLDREISHQVASETVWFCEHHGVKTIYFEDLRSFQGKGGMRRHSWNLSTNLWGMMIEGVRYRRKSMGHRKGGIWMVNPAWTSQTCHVCRERGVRVEDETSVTERKGGEYFHCSECDEHYHADVNAARNIMHIKQSKPSAVSGRTA